MAIRSIGENDVAELKGRENAERLHREISPGGRLSENATFRENDFPGGRGPEISRKPDFPGGRFGRATFRERDFPKATFRERGAAKISRKMLNILKITRIKSDTGLSLSPYQREDDFPGGRGREKFEKAPKKPEIP